MHRSKRVIFALGSLGEARQPVALAQSPDAVAASCQDLMRVGLMSDIRRCLSRGVSKVAWIATVSSTTPEMPPRWPPVTETASTVSARNSSAGRLNCSGEKLRRSSGYRTAVRGTGC